MKLNGILMDSQNKAWKISQNFGRIGPGFARNGSNNEVPALVAWQELYLCPKTAHLPESQNTTGQEENIPNSHMMRIPGDQGTGRELKLSIQCFLQKSQNVSTFWTGKRICVSDGRAESQLPRSEQRSCFGCGKETRFTPKLVCIIWVEMVYLEIWIAYLEFEMAKSVFGVSNKAACRKETCFTPKLVCI